jgi:hypothetical protein
VAGWSSGTGLAGMCGTVIYILMNSLDIKKPNMFFLLSPVCILYLICFLTVDYLFKLYSENDERKSSMVEIAAINTEDGELIGELEDYKKNKSLTWDNFLISFQKCYWYILNLFLVTI